MSQQQQEQEPSCSICLSEEGPFMDPMPCACRGSIAIHAACFEQLRRHQTTCGSCHTDFPPEMRDGLCVERGLVEGTTFRYEATVDANDEYHGLYVSRFNNGNIFESINYNHGEIHGDYIIYYENGNRDEYEIYENGLSLRKIKYFENGNVFEDTPYKNDKMHGLYKRYHPNGVLAEECYYEADVAQGIARTYLANGYLHVCSTFKDGKLHGYVYTFNSERKIVSRELFENDLIVECIRY
jgi:antitoxin component YwqK of YwqJK toxin-antitoxin module